MKLVNTQNSQNYLDYWNRNIYRHICFCFKLVSLQCFSCLIIAIQNLSHFIFCKLKFGVFYLNYFFEKYDIPEIINLENYIIKCRNKSYILEYENNILIHQINCNIINLIFIFINRAQFSSSFTTEEEKVAYYNCSDNYINIKENNYEKIFVYKRHLFQFMEQINNRSLKHKI